ncbi:MAG: TetR/AcrR family transcriptional regulator [Candidatus Abyssobacteria bacterium SURF_17]|jgi:AcrR family transcriptional regulator|uniref:TetR/AcrR family transcriptional regulator n=1 Tax=Candidatus Abyssobacteria bacterium SURF_17 TaxID=2093361 RepID=A0A419EUT9_9BACT|nr:MAG: TetR/AcrR family transcriptional regulator [Candidatus Abyssubacteria bacterium SURF_17]
MGVAERKEREKQARRQAILDAARECFFRNGFEATTISQIAETVELSTGTLYLYFKNKEEIYVSILEEGLEILYALMTSSERPSAPARELLEGYADAYYRFYTDYGQYFDIMFFLRRPDKNIELEGDLKEKLEHKSLECLGLVESVIKKGIAEGDFRVVSPYEASRILWGTMNGLMLLHEKRTEEITRQKLPRLIEVAVSLLLDGIRAKKA